MKLPPYLQQEKSGAWLLRLWVQPKASKSGFAGIHGDRLKVRVAASPVDGKANRELVRFLASTLDLAPASIELVVGFASRQKTVRIKAISRDQLLAWLANQ